METALANDPGSKQDFIRALLSPERPDPYELLTRLPLDPYHHVADVGCGPGYFSVPLAKYLSHGRLYALDVDDEMLEVLKRRVDAVPLGNVKLVKTDGIDLRLPPRSLDGMLLAYVVHYADDRLAFMEAAAETLKPSGWCCVLEWYRVETEHGPPVEKRIEPEEMTTLATNAGFSLQRRWELPGYQYMLLFKVRP